MAGVVLGISTLLWATGPGPTEPSRPPAAAGVGAVEDHTPPDAPALDEPAVEEPAPDELDDVPAPLPPPVPQPAPVAEPAPEPVLVLNNSRVPGLAARAAARLEAGGWPVRETGNLRGRIRATTVYYEPGQEAAARELARRFPGVERVLPRLERLPGDGLTVVVTRHFPA